MKFLLGFTTVCITMPIWYYLMYVVLKGVNASDLAWFLYWAYIPFSMFVSIATKAMEK